VLAEVLLLGDILMLCNSFTKITETRGTYGPIGSHVVLQRKGGILLYCSMLTSMASCGMRQLARKQQKEAILLFCSTPMSMDALGMRGPAAMQRKEDICLFCSTPMSMDALGMDLPA